VGRRLFSIGALVACTGLVAPAALGRASTQIEVPITVPKSGNITVVTAHARLNKTGGTPLKVTLVKGKHAPRGVSLYARPRRRGRAVAVDLVLTHAKGGKSAGQSARLVAVLNSNVDGFSRRFNADEQANVYDLPGGNKAEGKICDGRGSGRSRLIAGRHVFSSTDAGQVIKDGCKAVGGSRTGGAQKLQKKLGG
jgi:hypothetical protein